MKNKTILIVILIIAFALRIFNINNNSLYGDELTIGLDANSLLHTGQDQLGNSFPLTFRMGAGRPAGYVYLSIPFIAIFGPTALGVRMLSILSGMGIIILLYLLGQRLFDRQVGTLAAAIGAVSPWDISLSRGGFEAHLALFLALLAFYLCMLAREKPYLLILAAASFGLTLHTYPTYKVILLLFLPLLIWFSGGIKVINFKARNYLFAAVLVLAILSGLAATQTFWAGSEERFSKINVFSQGQLREKIEQKIDYERTINSLPNTIARFFHNQQFEFVKIIGENYLQNFSVDFLFTHGDRNPRHNMATMGQLYLIDAFLILTGLVIFWRKQKKEVLFLAGWILLSPIPTAFVNSPHGLRSSFMLPPLLILSALGLSVLMSEKVRVILGLMIIIFAVQFIFFIQKLFFLSPNEYSQFWTFSAKQASSEALENKNKYNYIILSDKIDGIEFAYPLYAKIDPSLIIEQNKQKVELLGYKFKKYDNVYIGTFDDGQARKFISNLKGTILYIGNASEKENIENYELLEGADHLPSIILVKKI